MQLKMVLERETKGALLYREVDANGVMIESNYEGNLPTVYIRKTSTVGKLMPKAINVTIAPA